MSGSRRRSRLGVAIVLSTVLLLASRPGAAQRATAADLERDARRAYEHHEFAAAARGFEAAYSAEPLAATKFNAALSWEMAGDPAHAADAYEAVLAAPGVDDERARQSRARLERLRPTLSRLSVTGPAGADVRVDGDEPRVVPVLAYITPGEHLVTWQTEAGNTGQQRVSATMGDTSSLTIPADPPAPAAAPAPAPTNGPSAPARRPADELPRHDAKRTWGVVSLGVGAAAAVGAVVLGEATLSNLHSFENGGDQDSRQRDRAILFQALTNVAWATAAVAGAVGGVLLLWPSSKAPQVAWTLSPSSSTLAIRGAF